MNDERRKLISKALTDLSEAQAKLEQARDEEQDAYENMPESTQSGDKGDKAQSAIDALTQALEQVEEATNSAQEALDS